MAIYGLKDYEYPNSFGNFRVQAEIECSPSDYEKIKSGISIAAVPHRFVNESSCLRQAAAWFYRECYHAIISGKRSLEVNHIAGIRKIMGLSVSQFAIYLGIRKGSASNILNGKRVLKISTQILLLDKLALELHRPGISLNVVNSIIGAPLDEEMKLLVVV